MSNSSQHPPVQMTQVFPGSRELVFRAWTTRAELESWFGPPGYTTTVRELDVRVGGIYRFEMQNPDGGVAYLTGRYVEIQPGEKLVYTWRWEDWTQETEDTLVTLEFHERGESTEIVITHQHFASEAAATGHKFAWERILGESLRKYLEP
ncbi:SRPBCC family protein [Tumebacillus flagellatus]|uniref:Activator of Hsp90 ATPase homologue 1/2-like C-terminal domain-containing protein n=1 Tax=Tumebacillus flagellatus TaxID=1157490 RepID=A0A074LS01_9BACL|nr:SRPBCC domain-containing protein [Tumebacillus flagellatus]KEO83260.1 hypothetical protein EL26_11255 [Tumebacillus flagellatus]